MHPIPLRCAAVCLGKPITRAGKCKCKKNKCAVGAENDLCLLGGTKQCIKGYSCQLPAGDKPGSFLGKCLAAPSRGGRRRH